MKEKNGKCEKAKMENRKRAGKLQILTISWLKCQKSAKQNIKDFRPQNLLMITQRQIK